MNCASSEPKLHVCCPPKYAQRNKYNVHYLNLRIERRVLPISAASWRSGRAPALRLQICRAALPRTTPSGRHAFITGSIDCDKSCNLFLDVKSLFKFFSFFYSVSLSFFGHAEQAPPCINLISPSQAIFLLSAFVFSSFFFKYIFLSLSLSLSLSLLREYGNNFHGIALSRNGESVPATERAFPVTRATLHKLGIDGGPRLVFFARQKANSGAKPYSVNEEGGGVSGGCLILSFC